MRKCNLIGEIKQRKKYYFGIKRTWLTNTKVVSNFKYGTDIVVTQRARVVSKQRNRSSYCCQNPYQMDVNCSYSITSRCQFTCLNFIHILICSINTITDNLDVNQEVGLSEVSWNYPKRCFSPRCEAIMLNHSQMISNNDQSGVADRREADARLGAVTFTSR